MLHDQAHCVSLDQKIVIVGGRQILSNQLWHQPVCVWLQTPPAARQSLKTFKRFRESEKKERAALLLRSRRNLCQVDRHISLGHCYIVRDRTPPFFFPATKIKKNIGHRRKIKLKIRSKKLFNFFVCFRSSPSIFSLADETVPSLTGYLARFFQILVHETAMTKEFEFQRNACRMRLPLLLKRSDLPFTAMPCDI